MPLLLLHLRNPNNIPQNIQPLLPVPRLLSIPFQMKRLGKVQRFLTSFTDLDAGEIKKLTSLMMIFIYYNHIRVGFSERKEGRKKERKNSKAGELTKTLPVTKTIMSSVVSPWMSIEAISCLVGAWEIKF